MKRGNKLLSFFVSVLLVSLVVTCSPYNDAALKSDVSRINMNEQVLAGIVHDPIAIDSDFQFGVQAEAESWLGDGSVSDPWIIEGYDIDVGGAAENGIIIENTTAHFIVRDCLLEGATQTDYAGIRLWNVTNGNLLNNRIHNNYYGILGNANHTVISNNVINTTTGQGIILSQSYYTQIIGNELIGTSLRLSSSAFIEIQSNVIVSTGGHSILVSSSDNITISGNNCTGGSISSVEVFVCEGLVLENNLVVDSYRGIYLDTITSSRVESTTLRGNTDGLYLYDSSDIRVMYCNITDNTNTGLVETQGSSGNIISWNEFLNNTNHVQDETLASSVYDFNYYDDYTGNDLNGDGFGEEPYVIPLLGDWDTHPLVYHPTGVTWSHTLSDHILELGATFSYDLNVTSSSPIYDWTINDNQYFFVDNEGVVTDKGNLEIGVYSLDVSATNVYGFSIVGSFSVTVGDSTDPVWITEARNKNYNYGNWIEFQIVVWDYAGIESWTISDNENFTLIEEAFGETGIATIINTHILAPGDYAIILEAFDSNANSVSMSFSVTVNVVTSPDPGPGIGSDIGFILSLAGIGVAVVALLFGVCAFLNTRKKPSK